jgi:hypothetical protein
VKVQWYVTSWFALLVDKAVVDNACNNAYILAKKRRIAKAYFV